MEQANSRMKYIRIIEQIGSGAHGSVYKAFDQILRRVVAVKIVPHNAGGDGHASSSREVEYLNTLPENGNIASLKYSFQATVNSRISSVLVFDLMENDLASYLSCLTGRMNNGTIKHLMRQLLTAINHCHQNGIMHRGIKPSNLLIDREMNLKLTDFGRACPTWTRDSMATDVVPLHYRAPELLLGCTRYSKKIDVWAAGCVFAEMIAGRVMFPGNGAVDQLLRIFSILGTPTEQTWAGVSAFPVNITAMFPRFQTQEFSDDLKRIGRNGLHLLARMLLTNPLARISAADALGDVYFS